MVDAQSHSDLLPLTSDSSDLACLSGRGWLERTRSSQLAAGTTGQPPPQASPPPPSCVVTHLVPLQCACRVVHSHSYLQLQQVHVLRSLFICNGYCSKRPPSPVQVRCKCLTARRLSAGAEGFSVDAPAATARFCISARIVSPGSRSRSQHQSCLVFVDGR